MKISRYAKHNRYAAVDKCIKFVPLTYATYLLNHDAIFGKDGGLFVLVPYRFHSDSDQSSDLPTKSLIRTKRKRQERNADWFKIKSQQLRQEGKRSVSRQRHEVIRKKSS